MNLEQNETWTKPDEKLKWFATTRKQWKPLQNQWKMTFSTNAEMQIRWNHTCHIRTKLISFSFPILQFALPLFLNPQNKTTDTPKTVGIPYAFPKNGQKVELAEQPFIADTHPTYRMVSP